MSFIGGSRQYSIVVRGRLSDRVASVFEGLTPSAQGCHTELRGTVVDQSALFGHLLRMHDLGIELVSVNRVAP